MKKPKRYIVETKVRKRETKEKTIISMGKVDSCTDMGRIGTGIKR